MSSLPDITEALCHRVAKGDVLGARAIAIQAGAKMGGPRGERVQKSFFGVSAVMPTSKHWQAVSETKVPWLPVSVAAGISSWLRELQHAEAIVAAGERIQPLMLVGETRCGKTTAIAQVAAELALQVYRLSLATIRDSHLGDSAKLVREAMAEVTAGPPAVWLIDEIDGAAPSRGGGGAGDKEMNHVVAATLTELDNLPSSVMLAATSNHSNLVDSAVLGRFRVVEWPKWGALPPSQKLSFTLAHGVTDDEMWRNCGSYAEAVQQARAQRVERIITGGRRVEEASEDA